MPAFPGKLENSHETNKNIGVGWIFSLREKIKSKNSRGTQSFGDWAVCCHRSISIGLSSSMLFLGKQAWLWPGAAEPSQILSKGVVLGRNFLYYLRRRSTPGGIWDILPTFLLPALSLSHFLHNFPFWGLSCHDCWYLCKRTMTKCIALCSFWLREYWGQATRLPGLGVERWQAKTVGWWTF